MIKLKDILLEMGVGTIKPIMDLYDENPEKVSSVIFPNNSKASRQEVERELRGASYEDFNQYRQELGVEIEESKEKPGLWANIRAQRARGEKPARKGTKAFKQAVKAADDINTMDELSLKKILGTTALAAGLAMSPNQAKAQEPNKAPTTQVQKQDTTTGFGLGKSSQEHTARTMARLNATKDLMQKLGKTELSAGIEILDSKTFQTKNGYEVEMKVKISQ